jgi:hypothetical protein
MRRCFLESGIVVRDESRVHRCGDVDENGCKGEEEDDGGGGGGGGGGVCVCVGGGGA